MFLGLSAHDADLVLLGGLLVVFAQALWRRDAGWIAALGLPILLCADHIGVAATLIAWGFALYAGMLAVMALTLLNRLLGMPRTTAFLAALAGTALLAGAADAHLTDSTLHAPPRFGIILAELARTIDAPPTAP